MASTISRKSLRNNKFNIIIANGAFKSGSTWLYNILRDLSDLDPPDKKYLNKTWINPSIDPQKLILFLKEFKESGRSAIVKNHFSSASERDIILQYHNVAVFNIERDPKDLVVSAYYHRINKDNYKFDFKEYYWNMGRQDLLNVYKYHKIWKISHPNIYTTNYEVLLSDFEREIKNISQFLGLEISDSRLSSLKEKTSLSNLKKKYKDNDNFFRKGIQGDWINYLDDDIIKDIEFLFKEGRLKNGNISLNKRFKKVIFRIYKNLKNRIK